MTPNQQKEEMSKAYVRAVAARCGYAVGTWSQDQGGLDVTIGSASPVGKGHLAAPKVDMQLKSTADQAHVKKKHVSYQFKTRATHDALVQPRSAPMYLVVLVLPKDDKDWVTHSPDELIMRRCAYYKLMTNEPAATVDSPTVKVPLSNVLSPDALTKLMEQVSMGSVK